MKLRHLKKNLTLTKQRTTCQHYSLPVIRKSLSFDTNAKNSKSVVVSAFILQDKVVIKERCITLITNVQ